MLRWLQSTHKCGVYLSLLLPTAILLQPAVPDAATKILDYLGVPLASRSFDEASMMLEASEFIGERIDNSRSFVAFPKLLK